MVAVDAALIPIDFITVIRLPRGSRSQRTFMLPDVSEVRPRLNSEPRTRASCGKVYAVFRVRRCSSLCESIGFFPKNGSIFRSDAVEQSFGKSVRGFPESDDAQVTGSASDHDSFSNPGSAYREPYVAEQ